MYHGSMCVALCVESMLKVEGEREKKNTVGKPRKIESCQSLKKVTVGKKLERNNKERLKNNILIKIEFWDVGGIIKWYGIRNKVAF